jgi:hypothetical protein
MRFLTGHTDGTEAVNRESDDPPQGFPARAGPCASRPRDFPQDRLHLAIIEVHQTVQKHDKRRLQSNAQNRSIKAEEFHDGLKGVNCPVAALIVPSFEAALRLTKFAIQEIESLFGGFNFLSRLPRF